MPSVAIEEIVVSGPAVAMRRDAKQGRKPRICDLDTKRLHARTVKCIFDRVSGKLIGWLQEWTTNSRVPPWNSAARGDVAYTGNSLGNRQARSGRND